MAKVRIAQLLRFRQSRLDRQAFLELHRSCRASCAKYVAGQRNSPLPLAPMSLSARTGEPRGSDRSSVVAAVGYKLCLSQICTAESPARERSCVCVCEVALGQTVVRTAQRRGDRTLGRRHVQAVEQRRRVSSLKLLQLRMFFNRLDVLAGDDLWTE